MKAPFSFFILAGMLLLSTPASGQIGFAAGLNFTSVSDLDGSSVQSTYDNATGYHVGVFFDLGAGPAALRIGAFYRELGEFDVSYGALRQTVDVTALDFPVDLRVNVLATPVVSPYLLAGPVFTVPRSSDESSNDSLEDFAVSGNVGFGIQIKAGGVKLLPEFRYAVGVTRLVKDGFTLAGRNIGAEAKDQRSNTAMLRLGIAF